MAVRHKDLEPYRRCNASSDFTTFTSSLERQELKAPILGQFDVDARFGRWCSGDDTNHVILITSIVSVASSEPFLLTDFHEHEVFKRNYFKRANESNSRNRFCNPPTTFYEESKQISFTSLALFFFIYSFFCIVFSIA